MLEVDIDKILPINEVKDNFDDIITEVSATDGMYVVTKNGSPAAVIVGMHHQSKLTGQPDSELMPDEEAPEEVTTEDETEAPLPELTPEEKAAESLRLRDKVLAEAMAMKDEDEDSAVDDDATPEVKAATEEANKNIDEFVAKAAEQNVAATLSANPPVASEEVTQTAPVTDLPLETPTEKPKDEFEFGSYDNVKDTSTPPVPPIEMPKTAADLSPAADEIEAPVAAIETKPLETPAPDVSNIYPAAPSQSDDDQFEIISTTPANGAAMSPTDKFDSMMQQPSTPTTAAAPTPPIAPAPSWNNQPSTNNAPVPPVATPPAPQATPQVYSQNQQ
jgi:prevent-host-death family protein